MARREVGAWHVLPGQHARTYAETQILTVGTLPADLANSGLRIPLGDSASIELWPELRDAPGGPLVVGYRAEARR